MIKNSLNREGHQNPISGSNVTAILLKQWILPVGGALLGRVCTCSLRSRLVLWKSSLHLEDTETLFSNTEALFGETYMVYCFWWEHKDGLLNVSNRYLFPQTPFPFHDRMTKPILYRFAGIMRPLFGQYEYLFENLIQHMCMFDPS